MMRFTAPTCNHAPALGTRAATPEPGHERTRNDAEHDDCSHPEEGEANYKGFILKHAGVSSAPRRTEEEGHDSKQDEPTDAQNKVELEKPLKDSWRDSPKYREHYQRDDKLHNLLPEGPVELRRLLVFVGRMYGIQGQQSVNDAVVRIFFGAAEIGHGGDSVFGAWFRCQMETGSFLKGDP